MAGFFRILVAALVVLYLTFDIGISPLSNQRYSYVSLFQYFETLQSEGARISLFRPSERIRGAAVFYLKRNISIIKKEERLKDFLCSGKMAVAISRKAKVKHLENLVIMKTFTIGSRTFVFVKDNSLD